MTKKNCRLRPKIIPNNQRKKHYLIDFLGLTEYGLFIIAVLFEKLKISLIFIKQIENLENQLQYN